MKSSLIKLENFLNEHRWDETNNNEHTHLSYGKIKGKFIFDKIQRKEFMNLYCKAIKNGNQLSILEKQKEFGPLVIDIDLKVNGSENERLYNDNMIMDVIKLYTNELNNYINFSENEKTIDYEYFIFEKNKPTHKEGIIKDGFHIMVPNLCLSFNDKFYLRDKVVKKASENNLFNNFLETTDKIIDKAIIKSNGWFLYGSTKPERLDVPYKLTKIYRYSYVDKKKITINKKQLFFYNVNSNLYKKHTDLISKCSTNKLFY